MTAQKRGPRPWRGELSPYWGHWQNRALNLVLAGRPQGLLLTEHRPSPNWEGQGPET